ncbi:MAG: ThiF family adenylyltransferase [Acidobacteriales bacterium]|nr:ThiF family adenylyltransferase [Terriglobales bacterium]
MTRLEPWYKRLPERLNYELEELRRAGIAFAQDQEALTCGKIRLTVNTAFDGQDLALVVEFPDFYPYFRFEVAAPSLDLPRHQHPVSKYLCLIGRATRNWKPSDTLAAFIAQRVPATVAAASGDPSVSEEPQGEPATDYFRYEANSIVLVDTDCRVPAGIGRGQLLLGLEQEDLTKAPLRGAVLQVLNGDGETLYSADPRLEALYQHRWKIPWFRLAAPPPCGDAKEAMAALHAAFPSTTNAWTKYKDSKSSIIGVLCPEEVQFGTVSDAWVFVVQVQVGKRSIGPYFARAGRAGIVDLASRIPELHALRDKKIGIVGLGCVGAPSALHLARAGVGELRLIDHDYIDPGTVVRWPFGFRTAGWQKVTVVKDFITHHYPFTSVKAWDHRIGDPTLDDARAMTEFFDGLDLVYDASTEEGINHLLSDLAWERRITYVVISTTTGAWGGRVVRIKPGSTQGCWQCMLHATEDNQLPTPPSSGEGIQPMGCANPTYAAAGFDTEEVALMGVRAATTALATTYPNIPGDVGILVFRHNDPVIVSPQWQWHTLARHPRCQHTHT